MNFHVLRKMPIKTHPSLLLKLIIIIIIEEGEEEMEARKGREKRNTDSLNCMKENSCLKTNAAFKSLTK